MGLLLKLLFGSGQQNTKREKNKHLEREIKQHGLFEDEKKLVRSGQYDPWCFEEEELDEDDYYYDD